MARGTAQSVCAACELEPFVLRDQQALSDALERRLVLEGCATTRRAETWSRTADVLVMMLREDYVEEEQLGDRARRALEERNMEIVLRANGAPEEASAGFF